MTRAERGEKDTGWKRVGIFFVVGCICLSSFPTMAKTCSYAEEATTATASAGATATSATTTTTESIATSPATSDVRKPIIGPDEVESFVELNVRFLLSQKAMKHLYHFNDKIFDGETFRERWMEREKWLVEGDKFLPSLVDESTGLKVHEFTEAEFPGYNYSALPMSSWGQTVIGDDEMSFVQAAVVLQHHLVNIERVKQGKEANNESLNVLHWIRGNLDDPSLRTFVTDDKGGLPEKVLKTILAENSRITLGSSPDGKLDTLPALVFLKMMREDFVNQSIHRHFGASTSDYFGQNHAALIVGERFEGDRAIYLLQNWWRNKQFVEVDDEYLWSNLALCYYVMTPQTEIPEQFQSYVESGVLRVSHDKASYRPRVFDLKAPPSSELGEH